MLKAIPLEIYLRQLVREMGISPTHEMSVSVFDSPPAQDLQQFGGGGEI